MNSIFLDKVRTTSELPVSKDALGNVYLNFLGFWWELLQRFENIAYLTTVDLLSFMATLGRNKSGGRNGISRLQYFLNAFSQELSLFLANPLKLAFVGDDHFWLRSGGTGTDDPDLNFFANNGNIYTLEAKMYFTDNSYFQSLPTTNFHTATYCIAYIITTGQWYFSKKSENYSKLYRVSELMNPDPWLAEINLPTQMTTIQFSVPGAKLSDLPDDLVPETVDYKIYTKNTIK